MNSPYAPRGTTQKQPTTSRTQPAQTTKATHPGKSLAALRKEIIDAQTQVVEADKKRAARYRHRENVMWTAHHQGMSIDEIATILRVKTAAVKPILDKAAQRHPTN